MSTNNKLTRRGAAYEAGKDLYSKVLGSCPTMRMREATCEAEKNLYPKLLGSCPTVRVRELIREAGKDLEKDRGSGPWILYVQ